MLTAKQLYRACFLCVSQCFSVELRVRYDTIYHPLISRLDKSKSADFEIYTKKEALSIFQL